MNYIDSFFCYLFPLAILSGCGIHTKSYNNIKHAVVEIEIKERGDSIKSEFQVLSKCLAEYPLIDDAVAVPVETITRNPPLGFKWKTFFMDSEMYEYLGYQAISISLKEYKNDFEYGGDLILTK